MTRQIPDHHTSEPQVKKQKGEEINEPRTNILDRAKANNYKDLDHVLEDIDAATADIIDILQLPNGASQYVPIPASQSELSIKVKAFKQRAHDLVRRERSATKGEDAAMKNDSVTGAAIQVNANSEENRVVMTLYGNAGGAKQLFSSFQIPTKIAGESKDMIQPIREAGLPNGISTTQIIPIQSTASSSEKKRVPTLGEIFPTPASVPVMIPPKPSKVATTRSATVGWYQPAAIESVPRTASYFRQSISSGQWLDYSNAISHQNTKKKSRERGLSLGGSKVTSLEGESAESEAAKLETLFRSAYSGFAPTKDEAAAVVPVGTMNQIWWQQAGAKSFSRMVENFESLHTVSTPEVEVMEVNGDDDLKKFEKLIQELEDDPIDPSLLAPDAENQQSIEEKDVEEILQGISELLETLNSYQRIRHSSLNSSSRPSGSLSVSDTASAGTLSKPNESEQNTYEIIKSQLALMVATLPPYAVVKLDADRLSELSISTRIEVQVPDSKGVMEEDESALRAKASALSAASAAARVVQPPTLHRPSQAGLYGNQYSPAPRVVPNPATQYYNGAQTPIRPPSNNMQRPPATAPVSYQNPRPVANAPYRPVQNYGTPNYPHQAPRPVPQHQQYAPQSQHQYPQHTPISQPPYMRPAGQNYQQMPQSAGPVQMNGQYPRQQSYPHQTHQSAAPLNGMAYTYNNAANMQRQASPQKAMYNSPQPAQARPYSTPTPANGINRQTYQQSQGQTPGMNGGSAHMPQPQFSQPPATTSGYQTFMNANEQESLIARQRAQMSQQQATAQQQARNAMQASMGSPPRGQPNGTNPVATNS